MNAAQTCHFAANCAVVSITHLMFSEANALIQQMLKVWFFWSQQCFFSAHAA